MPYAITAAPISVRIGWNTGPHEPSGCRLWLGKRDPNGYGRMNVKGRETSVPRFLLGLAPGDKRRACHTCDNPPCVNEVHLYAGTASRNTRDSVDRGRHGQSRKTHCRNGHPFTSENTQRSNGHRICRICNRAAVARYKRRKQ